MEFCDTKAKISTRWLHQSQFRYHDWERGWKFNGSPDYRPEQHACVLGCLRHDLLKGLCFPLDFLRICLDYASALVSEAAIVVAVRVVEEQS